MRNSERNDFDVAPEFDGVLWVACLCAEWCHICRDMRPNLTVDSRLSSKVRLLWVDIEQHADLLGELEVEQFPSYLIAKDSEVLLFAQGPVRADSLMNFIAPYVARPIRPQQVAKEVQQAYEAIKFHFNATFDPQPQDASYRQPTSDGGTV